MSDGHLHYRCKRCEKFAAVHVPVFVGELSLLAPGQHAPVHRCPDGGLGLTELVGGMASVAARAAELPEEKE